MVLFLPLLKFSKSLSSVSLLLSLYFSHSASFSHTLFLEFLKPHPIFLFLTSTFPSLSAHLSATLKISKAHSPFSHSLSHPLYFSLFPSPILLCPSPTLILSISLPRPLSQIYRVLALPLARFHLSSQFMLNFLSLILPSCLLTVCQGRVCATFD